MGSEAARARGRNGSKLGLRHDNSLGMPEVKDPKKEEKFEQSLERLQGLVRQLEGGDCSLEDSLQKFSEGMALAKKCQEKLTEAEQKIEILLKATKEGVSTAPFEDKE